MNNTAALLPFTRSDIEQTIPARFEAVVQVHGDRPALTGAGREWTYVALNVQTNRLAHAIRARTPGATGRVAFLLDHGPDMVVATLGVLKAGRTYVAVHPGLPQAAQAAILRDVEPDLLLTSAAREADGRALASGLCDVLRLDAVGDEYSAENPSPVAQPGSPSTLFYTSGSTGQPKGVVKSHRAVLHRVWLSTQHDRITPADRQSLLTHCSFSASEADMFGPLLQGAAVCTFDIATHGIDAFCTWLESERITLLHPPALFFRRVLATLRGANLFPHVRIVALAGDVVLPADLERWQRHFSPACGVLHRFSITETALLSVAHISRDALPVGSIVEAGRPVADKTLLLVDPAGAPVAQGDVGELIVQSAYLADGYWKRPEATMAAFGIEGENGRRAYRTGDLGRFEADGSFVFLGRRDHQVKIRGYRVDTREIESALLRLDGVGEIAVVPWREDGEQRLTAFIVWQDGVGHPLSRIRRQAREVLPEWKVPDRFTSIVTLPTTMTGKVDRRTLAEQAASALPEVDEAWSDQTPGHVTDLPQAAAAVFAHVLRMPSVPVDASFFDLGGNSLLVAELQVELQARFGTTIPLRDLLRGPTPLSIAALIERQREDAALRPSADPSLVPLRISGAGSTLFLVHGAWGLPPAERAFLDALGPATTVYSFRAKGFEGVESPSRRIDGMVTAYLASMRRHQPTGPYLIGGICAGSLVAIEMARRLRSEGVDVAPLLLFDPPLPPREHPAGRYVSRLAMLLSLLPVQSSRRVAERMGRRYDGRPRTPQELRVWLAFRLACFRHRAAAYDGPVHVLGSPTRNQFFRDGRWRRLLSGPVDVLDIAGSHRDVLASVTPEVAEYMRRVIAAAHA